MFDLPDFIRRTTPSMLNEYCKQQKLGINMKEDGEVDKNITSFIESLEALDLKSQKEAQAYFEEIGGLANEKGSQMLIQKMQESNEQTPNGFDKLLPHDRAIWTYLHKENAFRSVATSYEVENIEGWTTFRAPFIDKETAIKKKDVLAKAIAGYSMSQRSPKTNWRSKSEKRYSSSRLTQSSVILRSQNCVGATTPRSKRAPRPAPCLKRPTMTRNVSSIT